MDFEASFSPEPNSGCFLWLRGCDTNGYGEIRFEGKKEKAHRISAHLHLGFDLNSDLQVLHKCDVPCCVNPKHLFIGTNGDNVRDCVKKGRYRNQNSDKAYCIHGHPLFGVNLRITSGRRQCRECGRNAKRKFLQNSK